MERMASEKITINRTATGTIAFVCLGSSTALWFADLEHEQAMLLRAALMRVGLVMAALWLALPTTTRPAAWANVSPWILLSGIGAVLAFAAKPKLAIPAIPYLVAIAVIARLMRPKKKARPSRSSDSSSKPNAAQSN